MSEHTPSVDPTLDPNYSQKSRYEPGYMKWKLFYELWLMTTCLGFLLRVRLDETVGLIILAVAFVAGAAYAILVVPKILKHERGEKPHPPAAPKVAV